VFKASIGFLIDLSIVCFPLFFPIRPVLRLNARIARTVGFSTSVGLSDEFTVSLCRTSPSRAAPARRRTKAAMTGLAGGLAFGHSLGRTTSQKTLASLPIACIYVVSTLLRGVMIVEFCKWGNSLAVRIPKAVADALKVSDGKRAEIKVENGTLVLRPIVKPTRKPRYTLDDLLSGMTKDNVPQEVDWGPPRGNEAW
jgi:antitoxin MazE